jgi:proline iminopeptidase
MAPFASPGIRIAMRFSLLLSCARFVACVAFTLPAAFAAPASSGVVKTPDGDIYYELRGSGPPIVLVAGGPGSSRTSLQPEFDVLASDHTVVYFDNIGRGRSSDLPAGRHHSPARDAADIEYLRIALGYDKIALLGHSYGGYPALAYAAAHPEHLSRLVISSSGHSGASWQRNIDNVNRFVENQYPDVWRQLQAMRARGVRSCAAEYQELYGSVIGQLYWHDPAMRPRRPAASVDPRDGSHGNVYCDMIGDDSEVKVGGAMASYDVRPALARVHVPTLVTAGRFDVVCPPVVALQIRDAFPPGVAKAVIYENSAHRPWVEEGAEYFRALRAFLDDPQ